eukprot:gene24722-10359_t
MVCKELDRAVAAFDEALHKPRDGGADGVGAGGAVLVPQKKRDRFHRSHSDRQSNRPVQEQCAEWINRCPQLWAKGVQLHESKDDGVQAFQHKGKQPSQLKSGAMRKQGDSLIIQGVQAKVIRIVLPPKGQEDQSSGAVRGFVVLVQRLTARSEARRKAKEIAAAAEAAARAAAHIHTEAAAAAEAEAAARAAAEAEAMEAMEAMEEAEEQLPPEEEADPPSPDQAEAPQE